MAKHFGVRNILILRDTIFLSKKKLRDTIYQYLRQPFVIPKSHLIKFLLKIKNYRIKLWKDI
jgi:hypothetical protein